MTHQARHRQGGAGRALFAAREAIFSRSMSIDFEQHIARLVADRDYLGTFLAQHPGWVRLQQARTPPGDADELHRLTVEVERDLAGQPLHTAWRALTDAIAALEEVQAESLAQLAGSGSHDRASGASRVGEENREAVGEREVQPGATQAADRGEAAAPSEPAPPLPLRFSNAAPPPTMREVQRVALLLRDATASIETRAATIHAGPPDAWRNARESGAEAPRADALTDIRGIDRKLAQALVARGVRTFEEIAAFGPADVRTLSAALSLGRRINSENWIEQASVLAARARARRAEADAAAARQLPASAAAPGLDIAPPNAAGEAPSGRAGELQPAAETPPVGMAALDEADPVAAEAGLPPLIRGAAERIALLAAAAPRGLPSPEVIATAAPPRDPIAAAVERAAVAIAAATAAAASSEPVSSAAPSTPRPDDEAPPEAALPPSEPTADTDHNAPDRTCAGAADTAWNGATVAAPAPGDEQKHEIAPDTAADATDEVPTLVVSPPQACQPDMAAIEPHTVPVAALIAALDTPSTDAVAAPDVIPAADAPQSVSALSLEAPPAPEPERFAPDDLVAIRGIDADTAARLAGLGFTRFAEIATWGPREVESVRQALGPAARVSRDGWIEQAAVLARGQTTAHAAMLHAGALPPLAPRPPSPPTRDPVFALWLARQTSELPIPRPPRPVEPAPTPQTPVEQVAASPAALAETADVSTSVAPPAGAHSGLASACGGSNGDVTAADVSPIATAPASPDEANAVAAREGHETVSSPEATTPATIAVREQTAAEAPGTPEADFAETPRLSNAVEPAVEAGTEAPALPDDAAPSATLSPPPLAPPPLPASAVPPPAIGDRPEPVAHPLPVAAHAEPSPTASASPLRSISERMHAIERDLATLDILPIAPAKPRRMALPATSPADRGAPQPSQAPAPDLVPTEIIERSATAEPSAIDEEPFLDLAARLPDEAAVTIVRRAAREIGLDPLPPLPQSPAMDTGPEFDRGEYAAYRERVEEALVVIVKPGSPPQQASDTGADSPGSATQDGADGENPVRRFLKALTGA